jgi:hypothetical protein
MVILQLQKTKQNIHKDGFENSWVEMLIKIPEYEILRRETDI